MEDIDAQQAAALKEFEAYWEEGSSYGWQDSSEKVVNKMSVDEGDNIWCAACKFND